MAAGTRSKLMDPARPFPAWSAPPYADRASFTESEIVIDESPWPVHATLSMPRRQGPLPAALLVPGMGDLDRDCSVGVSKPFRDLAWGLASAGIVVLRFDKRTFAHAGTLEPLPESFTVRDELIADALVGLRRLLETEQVDRRRVFGVGHSLGAVLLPQIALEASGLAGLVLLAPAARPVLEVLADQVARAAASTFVLQEERQRHAEAFRLQVARASSALSADTPAAELPLGLPAAYWQSLHGYDPMNEAERLNLPMLVLWGERDQQVSRNDFESWQRFLQGRRGCVSQSLPGLDHLFQKAGMPGNLHADTIAALTQWIQGPQPPDNASR
jgi:alpha-beta hydrolase superfamily lysophospholipase